MPTKLEIEREVTLEVLMTRYQRAQDARILQRLLMLIHVKEGKSATEAAELVKVTNDTGSKWVKRFNEEGFDGLEDRERSGRPIIIDYDDVRDVIDNHTPEDFGYPHQAWFPRLLYQYLIDYQDQEGMHFEYVYEIIDRAGYVFRVPRGKHHK